MDIITSLVFASCNDFHEGDIVEKVIALKRAVPFEMRDLQRRILSTDEAIQEAVHGLLDEGLHSGWVEAVTMRYAEDGRRGIPYRLKELMADSPSLKDTLDKILAHTGLDHPLAGSRQLLGPPEA